MALSESGKSDAKNEIDDGSFQNAFTRRKLLIDIMMNVFQPVVMAEIPIEYREKSIEMFGIFNLIEI